MLPGFGHLKRHKSWSWIGKWNIKSWPCMLSSFLPPSSENREQPIARSKLNLSLKLKLSQPSNLDIVSRLQLCYVTSTTTTSPAVPPVRCLPASEESESKGYQWQW